MRNFMKNVDMEQITDQIGDLRHQLAEIKFRKPWTTGSQSSPLFYIAIGSALTFLGLTLFRKRGEVANFCYNCGAKIKDTLEQTGIKEKAGRFMGKVKEGAEREKQEMESAAAAAGAGGEQGRYYQA